MVCVPSNRCPQNRVEHICRRTFSQTPSATRRAHSKDAQRAWAKTATDLSDTLHMRSSISVCVELIGVDLLLSELTFCCDAFLCFRLIGLFFHKFVNFAQFLGVTTCCGDVFLCVWVNWFASSTGYDLPGQRSHPRWPQAWLRNQDANLVCWAQSLFILNFFLKSIRFE